MVWQNQTRPPPLPDPKWRPTVSARHAESLLRLGHQTPGFPISIPVGKPLPSAQCETNGLESGHSGSCPVFSGGGVDLFMFTRPPGGSLPVSRTDTETGPARYEDRRWRQRKAGVLVSPVRFLQNRRSRNRTEHQGFVVLAKSHENDVPRPATPCFSVPLFFIVSKGCYEAIRIRFKQKNMPRN